MQGTNRIIINTVVQYIRTIINMVLSLYSSRLVLEILGVEDYGIYALVGGVVSMLSFLNNSLVASTQRFLSVNQGKGNLENLKSVFNNCLILHIVLGFFITIVLECLTPFLFNGFLNIPAGRSEVAGTLYQLVVWMVYMTFVASPFRALLVSRENIVYVSIIDVIDGVLKVVLVLLLPLLSADKLMSYGRIMFIIQLFNLVSFSGYCYVKYAECTLPNFRTFSLSYLKEMFAFTGWIIYSTGVIAIRTQGFAIVLNRALGAVVNAAYGVGSQISGMIGFVSSSFNNAINPQLMASEGGGDRNRMLRLAEAQSKFSFLLLAMLGIPTMFEMQTLLELWLLEVPENTKLFGCTFLTMQVVDMFSTGLASANRAIGNIGKYTLVTFTPKLFILPIAWVLLKYNFPLWVICILMIAVETLSVFLRIYLFKDMEGFDVWGYCKMVILKTVPPVVASVLVCWGICSLWEFHVRFIVTYIVSVILFALVAYMCSLECSERAVVCRSLDSIRSTIYLKLNSF